MRRRVMAVIGLALLACGMEGESRAAAQEGGLRVHLETNRTTYREGDPIVVTYIFENDSKSPIVYLERCFLEALRDDGMTFGIVLREYLMRSDWRESRTEYRTLAPGQRVRLACHCTLVPPAEAGSLPWTVHLRYRVTRREADNFHYNFDEEGFWARTKVPIAAWTGTLISNPVTVRITERKAVSREEALATAESVCRSRGWEWRDIGVRETEEAWEITTCRQQLGMNAFVLIDKATGSVLETHLTGP